MKEDSGWTLTTLKQLMDERDRRYGEIAAAKEKAVEAAFAAAEKAVATAEANAEKWRASANEWRSAMNDRERDFLPRNIGYIIGALSVITLVMSLFGKLP
jgi:hypothetical protein